MKVRFHLGEPLWRRAGARQLTVTVGSSRGNVSLEEALRRLVEVYPDLAGEAARPDGRPADGLNVFVNGELLLPGRGQPAIKDGDEVTIMMPLAGGSGPASGPVGGDDHGEVPRDLVVDFHIHLARYESVRPSVIARMREAYGDATAGLIEQYSSPDAFLRLMDSAGIDYAVVLAEISPITTGIASNERVRDFCRDRDRLIPFASINPYITADPARELRRLVEEEGFRGLKLYPVYNYFYPNDANIYPLYAVAEELGIPVMVHTGSSVFEGARLKYGDPLFLDDVAVDFPRLNVLMVHSGRGFWYDRAFFLARVHDRVFMEIAGLPPQRLLEYFPAFERNADKIVYGTDWPDIPHLAGNIERIRGLPLSAETKAKVLGLNAAKILGLPPKRRVSALD